MRTHNGTAKGFLLEAFFEKKKKLHFSEPIFVDAHLIPDGTDPNDAKLYFFFRERLTDNSGNTKNIHTMVARVCPVCWPAKPIFYLFYSAVIVIFTIFLKSISGCRMTSEGSAA